METVSVTRTFDAEPDRIRSVFNDVTTYFDAAGFEVERDDNRLELTKHVAVMQIELNVQLCDDQTAALAYEQIAGPFEAMTARYVVDQEPTGSSLTIETSFDPPSTGFGTFLNGAAVNRQRQAELDTVASLIKDDSS